MTSSALRTLISQGPAAALSCVTVTVPAVAATTGVPQAASKRVSRSSGGATARWHPRPRRPRRASRPSATFTSNDVPGGSGRALTSDAEA